MLNIAGYSDFKYFNGKVFKNSGALISKTVLAQGGVRFKMKNDVGTWFSVSERKIKSLTSLKLVLPDDAVVVPHSKDTYITPNGEVFTYSTANPQGTKLTIHVGSNGYPRVTVFYKDKYSGIAVHRLLLEAFVDKDYISKGLCCLHKDDNKLNYCLDNLKIGTYSENNKDAYRTGLNPGNGL